MKTKLFATLLTVAGSWFAAPLLVAAEPKPVVQEELVELFEGEKAGKIQVRFIPKDATEATVFVRNLTDAPIRIKLPEAFAAVPANAQMGMGGMGGMGGGGMGGMGGGGMGGMGGGGMGGMGGGGMGGGMQGMGGGMGGMGGGGMGGGGMGGMGGMGGGGMGGMGMGGMGGMMRIPAEKQFKLKVATVCLEHGKKDPNPRVTYKMIPANQFSDDPRVWEVCRLLGYRQMSQNVAQAAAWHLTDGLAWDFLARKAKSQDPVTKQLTMWFHPQELQYASLIVASANQTALTNPAADSEARETQYRSE